MKNLSIKDLIIHKIEFKIFMKLLKIYKIVFILDNEDLFLNDDIFDITSKLAEEGNFEYS